MSPCDWELERDSRWFYRRVAVVGCTIAAAALAAGGVGLLVAGRPAGFIVLTVAAFIGVVAWGLGQ